MKTNMLVAAFALGLSLATTTMAPAAEANATLISQLSNGSAASPVTDEFSARRHCKWVQVCKKYWHPHCRMVKVCKDYWW